MQWAGQIYVGSMHYYYGRIILSTLCQAVAKQRICSSYYGPRRGFACCYYGSSGDHSICLAVYFITRVALISSYSFLVDEAHFRKIASRHPGVIRFIMRRDDISLPLHGRVFRFPDVGM